MKIMNDEEVNDALILIGSLRFNKESRAFALWHTLCQLDQERMDLAKLGDALNRQLGRETHAEESVQLFAIKTIDEIDRKGEK